MFCVVILGMWAVSTRVLVMYFFHHGHVGWAGGSVSILRLDPSLYVFAEGWHSMRNAFPALSLPSVTSLTSDNIAFSIPFWLLLLVAAIPTAILWHRDRRTVKPGCCLTCGYDLRASKKTCPECGTAIANPT